MKLGTFLMILILALIGLGFLINDSIYTHSELATANQPMGVALIAIADATSVNCQVLQLPPHREHTRVLSALIAMDIVRRRYLC